MALDKLEIKLPSGPSFNMILVEGGPSLLGEGSNAHPVTMPPFYIGEFPVTQELWKAVMKGEEHPSRFQGPQRPKTDVSWLDITQYFLPALEAITGKRFRLPSESEWEYAARGGNKSEGFEYAGSNHLDEVGWYNENSYGETKAVGLKLPNELGLYDMSGNVWEWCEDDWHDDYNNAPDDCSAWVDAPERGTDRVQRGGSYFNNAENCRSANRNNNSPENRNNNIGFRLVVPAQLTGKPDGFHRTGDGPVSEYSGRKGDRKRAQKRRHW